MLENCTITSIKVKEGDEMNVSDQILQMQKKIRLEARLI